MQFLAKSIKPFRIYRKIKHLTFDFLTLGQGHRILFIYLSFLWLLYGANVGKIREAIHDL